MKHDDNYWLKAAEDIKRFRKGRVTMHELMERYPELNIQEDYLSFENIKESIHINIPAECPSHCAAIIAFATDPRKQDINRADRWLTITIAYRPEWERLSQVGELISICKEKKEIKFNNNYIYNRQLVLRRCIEEGDHGDEDGYGMEPDTWLIGKMDSKGRWLGYFYIER